MKKLLGIVVLGLLWCNVGYSEHSVSAEKVCKNIGFEPGTEEYNKCKFEFLKEFETKKYIAGWKLVKSIKKVCKNIGFEPGTEKYNKCKFVLEIELEDEELPATGHYKELKMKLITPLTGFDFICYNACKDRNDEIFCRQKCSIQ